MRKLLRWICQRCGLVTWYHVAATYPLPNGYATVSFTCWVRPWLHADNYQDLEALVAARAQTTSVKPNILSLTRLGP